MKFTLPIAAAILSFSSVALAAPAQGTVVRRENYDDKHAPKEYKEESKKYEDEHAPKKYKEEPKMYNNGNDWDSDAETFWFTSTYSVKATPDMIINADGESVPGLEGASGWYRYGINSVEDYICYNIELYGFPDADNLEYQSPASTSTHIHEAVKGAAGPPRLAFPNPEYRANGKLQSLGCLIGPFRTGLNAAGTDRDTAEGFTVKQIEDNPSGFFTDVHTSEAVAGAVRGQLA